MFRQFLSIFLPLKPNIDFPIHNLWEFGTKVFNIDHDLFTEFNLIDLHTKNPVTLAVWYF